MTRFTEDRHSGPDRSHRNGAGPGVPSFLRAEPEDRPEPTDLALHFQDAGPSFRSTGRTAGPSSAPAASVSRHAGPPEPDPAPTQQWTPALAYRAVAPSAPKPDDYEVKPDSYLAAAEALKPSSEHTPEEAARAEAREWDPLTDPWPMGVPAGANLETLLERAALERVAPYGLMRYEPDAFALPSLPRPEPETKAPAYSPVVFTPAPFVEDEDPALMTQPYEMAPEHPSGPLPRHGQWPPAGPVPDSPAVLTMPKPVPDSAYDVTLTGPLGTADLGFAAGQWHSIAGEEARRVTVGDAVWSHPELAGQIVQVACWWMRENPKADRALDLATEIAMAVSDAVRGNRTPLVF